MLARLRFAIGLISAFSFLLIAAGLQAQPAAVVAAPASASAPQAPSWIPLPDEHAKHIDQILAYWEHQSKQIQRYRCRFKRWEYDPDWVGNPDVPKSYSEGVINYAAPDKGRFFVETSKEVVLPLTPGQQPNYRLTNEQLNEHWICDGKSIFQFDGTNKQLVQRELPPEMQGKQIVEGPLPFLFGAKAGAMQARYWIRAVVPPPKQGVFWLEAWPKTREDAANFRSVQVIISESDWLPEGMVLSHRSKAKTTFAFEQREKNWNDIVEKMNFFHRQFFEPKAPAGWKKLVEKYQEPSAVPVSVPAPAMLQTQRPQPRVAR